jgi:hypothetical protein
MFKSDYEAAWDQYFSLNLSTSSSCAADAGNPTDGTGLLGLTRFIPSVSAVIPSNCRGHDNLWGRAYVRRATETVLSNSSSTLLWRRLGVGLNPDIPSGAVFSQCTIGERTNAALTLDGSETELDSSGNIDVGLTIDKLKKLGSSKVSTYYTVSGVTSSGERLVSVLSNLGVNGSVSFYVADDNALRFNPMPKGTTVSVEASDGITVKMAGGETVGNSAEITGAAFSFKFESSTSGTITVKTKTPKGLETAHSIAVYLNDISATPCGL